MAKVLVRKTARTAPTLEALCGTLAEQIAETAARDKFLAKCLLAARTPSRSSRPGFTAPAPPSEAPTDVRGAGPSASSGPARTVSQGTSFGAGSADRSLVLSEQDLHFVETELARHVGPLARILVKRAAKGEGNMSHVMAKLELEIDSEESRRAFREAVRKRLR
jgi:serine/threonine-protein kinase